MTGQEKRLAKKRGRPATGRGQTIGVRLQPDMLALLDAWRTSGQSLTRPDAIRRLLDVVQHEREKFSATLPLDTLAALDTWASAQTDSPSRPEAIRLLLAERLAMKKADELK
jgi:metal-responsive CopG/Arc/MetJ family transcriptional regulator